jgi:hypothetical protein
MRKDVHELVRCVLDNRLAKAGQARLAAVNAFNGENCVWLSHTIVGHRAFGGHVAALLRKFDERRANW